MRVFECGDRGGHLALHEQRHAESGVAKSKIWVQLDGAARLSDRPVEFAQRAESAKH
jgi:hypothetical protein